jgi:hypothetical protein
LNTASKQDESSKQDEVLHHFEKAEKMDSCCNLGKKNLDALFTELSRNTQPTDHISSDIGCEDIQLSSRGASPESPSGVSSFWIRHCHRFWHSKRMRQNSKNARTFSFSASATRTKKLLIWVLTGRRLIDLTDHK